MSDDSMGTSELEIETESNRKGKKLEGESAISSISKNMRRDLHKLPQGAALLKKVDVSGPFELADQGKKSIISGAC